MKRIVKILVLSCLVALFSSCITKRTVYDGPAYVAFSDTLFTCPVWSDDKTFEVSLASTVACGYDRTFGVEVLPSESTAIYGRHFTFESHSVTIPAGERVGTLKIHGIYENVLSGETPTVTLKLALVEPECEWSLYGLKTKVQFQRVCPLDINAFVGKVKVTSTFLMEYNYSLLKDERIVEAVRGTKPNTLIIKDIYYNGIDIEVILDDSDPLKPTIKMAGEQKIADTRECFQTIYGDGAVLADDYYGYENQLNICEKWAVQYVILRVDGVGVIGLYPHLLEWIND